MTKEEKFAKAMSEVLFQMRGEDIAHSDSSGVPEEFLNKTLEDPAHIVRMKKRIHDNVLVDVTQHPNNYMQRHSGQGDTATSEFVYSGDIYDHAYSVDRYIEELYEEVRKARLKVRYVVRLEVERIEHDPEDGTTDFFETDTGETAGDFDNFEAAVAAQSKASNLLKKGYVN